MVFTKNSTIKPEWTMEMLDNKRLNDLMETMNETSILFQNGLKTSVMPLLSILHQIFIELRPMIILKKGNEKATEIQQKIQQIKTEITKWHKSPNFQKTNYKITPYINEELINLQYELMTLRQATGIARKTKYVPSDDEQLKDMVRYS